MRLGLREQANALGCRARSGARGRADRVGAVALPVLALVALAAIAVVERVRTTYRRLSDIAVPGYLGSIEVATFADYPDLPAYGPTIRRRVLHSLKWAEVTIRNVRAGFQPSYDVIWPIQTGIDTELRRPSDEFSDADGQNSEVVVLHAPNHRRIKGTQHLERAVSELRAHGLKVDLRILEGRLNDEVRAAVAESDIVADQFLAGYGLFAMEAMAAGKPVLSNLRLLPDGFPQDTLDQGECPIVDTDPDRLRDDLARLVGNPGLRRELGDAGRGFVMRHHSYEASGRDWEAVVEIAWRGRSLPQLTGGPGPETGEEFGMSIRACDLAGGRR